MCQGVINIALFIEQDFEGILSDWLVNVWGLHPHCWIIYFKKLYALHSITLKISCQYLPALWCETLLLWCPRICRNIVFIIDLITIISVGVCVVYVCIHYRQVINKELKSMLCILNFQAILCFVLGLWTSIFWLPRTNF
jgi:hypothetical protein